MARRDDSGDILWSGALTGFAMAAGAAFFALLLGHRIDLWIQKRIEQAQRELEGLGPGPGPGGGG